MHDHLRSLLQSAIPAAPLRGSFFRGVPLAHIGIPLSAIGSIRRGGRYNAKGTFEVSYFADRPDNSLREVGMLVDDDGTPIAVPSPSFIVCTVNVRLQHVVDLRDAEKCRRLDVRLDELVSAWRPIVAQGNVPMTHTLGTVARDAGIEALLVPSAKYAGSTNLAIIRDRLREGSNFSIYMANGFPSGTETTVHGTYRPRGASR